MLHHDETPCFIAMEHGVGYGEGRAARGADDPALIRPRLSSC
ncbi:MAG TPA: hypothetical protein VIG96_10795 [Blastococcus sp.]